MPMHIVSNERTPLHQSAPLNTSRGLLERRIVTHESLAEDLQWKRGTKYSFMIGVALLVVAATLIYLRHKYEISEIDYGALPIGGLGLGACLLSPCVGKCFACCNKSGEVFPSTPTTLSQLEGGTLLLANGEPEEEGDYNSRIEYASEQSDVSDRSELDDAPGPYYVPDNAFIECLPPHSNPSTSSSYVSSDEDERND